MIGASQSHLRTLKKVKMRSIGTRAVFVILVIAQSMRILNWIHFAVISFVFSQRRTTTDGETLAPQPKSPVIDTSTTTSTTDSITTSTITSTITASSTTITSSSTTFTVSETVTPVAQESSYDLVWIIGAIVAVCLLLSVTFAFFLYCCKSPQNPIQYSMSMDRRYQSNYDYKPPKLFAEYTLPNKQQESYSRPIAAHMNNYSRPPTHSNQFRQPVMNTVPVQMDDGYYYYDVNGNPTEPYYFDDYNNVVFVDQNGYAVRTVPNPSIQQPVAVGYDNNINQHPQTFTQPTVPPPIEKDEFYKNNNRSSSLFASSSVNNTIKKNDEIMEWFDPAKVTEDEKVETNKDIMEWFKTPLEPLESKFPGSGGSNSDKVADSPAILGPKNTSTSGEIGKFT